MMESNGDYLSSKMAPKMMQPEIVSREIIKPSSSTPNHHPIIHNLSFFDQICPRIYIPLLYFYSSQHAQTHHHRSTVLKVSLSATLSHYYPLAGRIKDGVTVDCNDDGVLFLEARTECNLSEILNDPDNETLKLLFPDSLFYKDSTSSSPVTVQVTYFKCGGMSIGLCLCHKMLDMASMSSFIDDWASIARKSEREFSPEFNIGSLYPPLVIPTLKAPPPPPQGQNTSASLRLVFYGSKIARLREMIADQVHNPTRVEAVAALLYKSATSAAAKVNSSGSLKPSIMNHVMNLRAHVSPQASGRNKGNMVGFFPVSALEDREVELGWLVEEFRRSKTQLSNANTSNREEVCSLIMKTLKVAFEYFYVEHEMYTCTSWCRNPFYESDFGWGKPLWVATVCSKRKNMIYLTDTKEGDGIEAFISLEEKMMDVFKHNEELLSFSVVNPSILDLEPSV